MTFKKEIGINPVNEDERPQTKIKDQTGKWWLHPAWIQTMLIGSVVMMLFFMNYVLIVDGFTRWITGITGFQLSSLFFTSFGVALIGLMYAFLSTYFMGNLNNKILYCKLFRKRLMLYLGSDKIFRFFVPETPEGFWTVDGIGEFKTNSEAMGWLENGLLIMPTVHGHSEGVNLEDIKDQNLLIIDPKPFEDRNHANRLEEMERESKFVNPQLVMTMVPVIMIIGIVAWLLIGQTQDASCQKDLVYIASQLASARATENITFPSPTTTIPLVNSMMGIPP